MGSDQRSNYLIVMADIRIEPFDLVDLCPPLMD